MGVIQSYVTGFPDRTYAGTLLQEQQNECSVTDKSQCGTCFNEDTGALLCLSDTPRTCKARWVAGGH